MKYKIIVDSGIPYTENVKTDKELKQILQKLKEKSENESHLDIIILNETEIDISKTQFIQKMIENLD